MPMTQQAISFTSAGTIAATTVQAAIEEVASEAGGGSGYRTKVTLGSDVANATNVLADGTGLSFAVSAGTVYGFEFMVRYTASAASIGARFALNGPAFTEFGYTSQWTKLHPTSNLVANWQSYDAGATSTASAGTFGNICIDLGSDPALCEWHPDSQVRRRIGRHDNAEDRKHAGVVGCLITPASGYREKSS